MATANPRILPGFLSEGEDAMAMPAVPDDLRYVARQPILDTHGNVHGYELLFRRGADSTAFDGDGNAATRTVLDNSIVFGLERLTGGLPMFVNCTREALVEGLVRVLPAEHTVLELLETLEPDAALLRACHELKASGYRIALDDFRWQPSWQPFFEIADYIKLELPSTTRRERAELKERIGSGTAKLILERVETQQDLAQARREGFKLFQGFYFCRPQMMENRELPANRLVHLEILQAVLKDPLDVRRISDLVKREPSLAYRLLRIANSPIYATRQAVSSIQAALVMIGDEMFRRVAMLATAAELRGNRPTELLRMAFLRGRFCELAAALTAQNATEQYLLGMFSLLPAMMSVPMESVVKALALRQELHLALLGQQNEERTILNWIECFEAGQWECCDRIATNAGILESSLARLYAEAVLWAEANMKVAAG